MHRDACWLDMAKLLHKQPVAVAGAAVAVVAVVEWNIAGNSLQYLFQTTGWEWQVSLGLAEQEQTVLGCWAAAMLESIEAEVQEQSPGWACLGLR